MQQWQQSIAIEQSLRRSAPRSLPEGADGRGLQKNGGLPSTQPGGTGGLPKDSFHKQGQLGQANEKSLPMAGVGHGMLPGFGALKGKMMQFKTGDADDKGELKAGKESKDPVLTAGDVTAPPADKFKPVDSSLGSTSSLGGPDAGDGKRATDKNGVFAEGGGGAAAGSSAHKSFAKGEASGKASGPRWERLGRDKRGRFEAPAGRT
jgi:hypothetical protein